MSHRSAIFLWGAILILSSCKISTVRVGNDSDSHGCKGSAGYVWSDLQKTCVRPFEVGLQAVGVIDSTRAAYLLFSTDSLRAELFLPSGKEIVVRERNSHSIDRYIAPKPSTTLLIKTNSGWQIQQNKKLLFVYIK